jgi:dTDP-4-dehydrorhamnose reductase
MSVLVIGRSGQLATELHRLAPSLGSPLPPSGTLDLADPQRLVAALEALRPSVILNAGAYTAVDRAEQEGERAFAVNAAGPGTLARWCAENGASLIHVSTDYVFDGAKATPYEESDATGPLGVYGASKLAGEKAIAERLERHVILRTSWVFSATGNNFVKTMLKLALQRDELRVVADQHGKPTSAAELARVMLQLVEKLSEPGFPWGTYHFACPESTTWHGFAQAIIDEQASLTRRRPQVTPITSAEYPTPARRPANSVLSCRRFEEAFGLQPRPWRDELPGIVRELVATSARSYEP